MVQVENEPGLLFDSRDGSELANAEFSQDIPPEIIDLLTMHYEGFHPDLKQNLGPFVDRPQRYGNWEAVFGKSAQTDELFMAYHYTKYMNRVASTGKAVYPLPLYANVWQNYAGDNTDNDFPIIAGGGGKPGDYPSGGATTNVLDIW